MSNTIYGGNKINADVDANVKTRISHCEKKLARAPAATLVASAR